MLGSVADGQAADIDAAVAAARRAFDEGPWPRLSAAQRASALRRIAALMREHAQEFIDLEVLDIGMPVAQMGGLAARAAANFDYYAGVITELHGRSFQVGDEFINYTVHKPVGVAGLIMPWNAPLMLSTWRIAPALAAGNTIVLKPAEWSPLTSTLLARVLEEAELPPGVFNVVQGFGETAGAPLSAHPGVDLVVFTGRDRDRAPDHGRGRADAQAALDGAGREVAGGGVRRRRSRSSPSTPRSRRSSRSTASAARPARACSCSAALHDGSSSAVAERARHIRVGDPSDARTELGPLIHPEHHERVLGLHRVGAPRGSDRCSPAAAGRPAWTAATSSRRP